MYQVSLSNTNNLHTWFQVFLSITINYMISSNYFYLIIVICFVYRWFQGGPCGVMIKAMDCGIVVSEFELQSLYYVHFWINTLGKGMNPLILQGMG